MTVTIPVYTRYRKPFGYREISPALAHEYQNERNSYDHYVPMPELPDPGEWGFENPHHHAGWTGLMVCPKEIADILDGHEPA